MYSFRVSFSPSLQLAKTEKDVVELYEVMFMVQLVVFEESAGMVPRFRVMLGETSQSEGTFIVAFTPVAAPCMAFIVALIKIVLFSKISYAESMLLTTSEGSQPSV